MDGKKQEWWDERLTDMGKERKIEKKLIIY